MPRLKTSVRNGRLVTTPASRPAVPRSIGMTRRLQIAARDNWTCQICFEAIDSRLRKPHQRALHIDHLDQHAHGGTHQAANLRATHAACNMARRG